MPIFGSITVRTKKHCIPVKLVFVRNRNKHNEYIIILSTDCSLSNPEVIRRYGYRLSIECCHKVCKFLLKFGRKFQPVNYDSSFKVGKFAKNIMDLYLAHHSNLRYHLHKTTNSTTNHTFNLFPFSSIMIDT